MILAATVALALAGPQLTRLPNGIPVIVETTGKDLVSFQVLVRTDDLTAIESGAIETMASALFGETENYSLRELRRLAWAVGGSVTSVWAGDCLRLEIATTSDRLNPAAALMSDALRRPVFAPGALDQARLTNQSHQAWLDRTPPLRAIRTNLARRDIAPLPVTSLTKAQAVALHAKVFRPERVSIAVVGDTTAEAVAKALGASLGLWEPKEVARTPPLRPDSTGKTGEFHTALATVEGPKASESGFAAWVVACISVGEGKQSLLNRKYRIDRGLSYITGSYFTFRDKASYCTFYVSWSGDKSAVTDLVQTVAAHRPAEQEIARAKALTAGRYLVGGPTEVVQMGAFSTDHSTRSSRAFWLAWWEMKGAGIGRDSAFPGTVRSLTPEQVTAACAAWLTTATP
ncbi:MAG: insulinase family protein [Armatimonadota bacterium]|nr:insulinase family protein [Armatimonadota bacterium]